MGGLGSSLLASWGASGGLLGQSLGQNVDFQFRKHVLNHGKNMMGNDPQRTGYVVSNHLLTPDPYQNHVHWPAGGVVECLVIAQWMHIALLKIKLC